MTRPLRLVVSLFVLALVTAAPAWAVPLKINVSPAGATILGDGTVAMIIDAGGVIGLARKEQAGHLHTEQPKAA